MKIFELAFQAAVELQSQRDQETQDYVEQLQEKLVESYTCMLHGFNNKQENEQLLPYFFKLIEFLKRTCNPNLNPTIDYLRSSLTLICDIAQFYKYKVVELVKTQFTLDLINLLKRYTNNDDNKLIVEYAEKTLEQLK